MVVGEFMENGTEISYARSRLTLPLNNKRRLTHWGSVSSPEEVLF